MKKKGGQHNKKQVKNLLFGASLLDEGVPQRVSRFLDVCFGYLERNDGLKTEGLFRMCGSKPDIQLLKEKANADPDNFVLESVSINDVTGLLKLFFGDMPDPLLSFELYFAFIAASGSPDEGRYATIKTVVNLLPNDNKILLNKICQFLNKISSYSEYNLMSPTNLATCIAFNLIRPEVDDPKTIIGDASLICTLFTSLLTDPDYFFPGIGTSFPDNNDNEDKSNIHSQQPLATTPEIVIPEIDVTDVEQQPAESKTGLRCGYCDKIVYAAECQQIDNINYHPACVRKKASNQSPWSSPKEQREPPNQKETSNQDSVNPQLSTLAQQYQMHRNKSQMKLIQVQKRTQLTNEQFEENLQSLSHKIKDGEIDVKNLTVEQEHEKIDEKAEDSDFVIIEKPKEKLETSNKSPHKPDKFEAKLEKLIANKEKEKKLAFTKSERQRKVDALSPRADLNTSKSKGTRTDRAVSDTPEPRYRTRQHYEEGDEKSPSRLLTNWGKQISAKFIEKRKPKNGSTPTIHEKPSGTTFQDRRSSAAVPPTYEKSPGVAPPRPVPSPSLRAPTSPNVMQRKPKKPTT